MSEKPGPGHDEEARGGRFAGKSLVDSRAAELLGICRGVLADQQLHDSEIVTIDRWLAIHGASLPEWPWSILARNIRDALSDGVIDDGERTDLLSFLSRLTGEETDQSNTPTSLPYSDPAPLIQYVGRSFCLTGTFVFGSRARVRAAIEAEGGVVIDTPRKCDFLVIGGTVTPAWKYGAWGRKIEEGVEARDSSGHPAIVREEDWVVTLC